MAEQAGFERAARDVETARAEETQPDHLLWEVLTVKALLERLEDPLGDVNQEMRILLPRGKRRVDRAKNRSGPENLDQAINDQAGEDDREGTRYAAVREKNYLEKTPAKKVETKWL